MKVVKTIDEVKQAVREWREEGLTIGAVPTMGYLHEGHLSLIDRSVKENDRTVVSVFVNPIQFGPSEDLESYPRDIERDSALCRGHGADIVFNPEPGEMYKDGFSTFVDMSVLTEELCGLSRPTHFRGVCTVVTKLFNIITPDRAYFGEKDAQQLAVIKHMVRDLNMNVTVVGCPIVREADGLAKSSRNTYLSGDERSAALILSRTLALGRKMIEAGERDVRKITDAMKKNIETEKLARIDYVKIVDIETMQQVETIDRPVLCAMAVYIGKTRLIDNFSFTEGE
ncbi:MAG TPA: pantoate--beta-alanine ligase [Candidatus Ornithomonoglobus intestinigallinarum]|uniref:Pantothenate synthetase n=1 Tax=Candidatus Ornithomonoglobus intestinigallinarum TaxID=2840894 RepID=A0A9D1H171_9FIRM|nr:pantoate--beta-alanine ligase [Candidatus Ornithomonoglobus intestinigallinarum]